MQAKKVKSLGKGNVDKSQTIETVARNMRTGEEISRSAATYTTGTPKGSPVQRMADQLASKQYEQNNRKGSTLVHKRSSRG